MRVTAFGHEAEPEEEGDRGNRNVDQEDRLPVEPLEQQAARQRAEADSEGGGRGPDGDRFRAFLTREDVRDDRQRGGHDQRRADAHQGADADQLAGGADEHDAQARKTEDRGSGLEGPLAPEPIAEGTEREDEAGEDEQVGVHDPLQRRAFGAELILERGEGDVQDRVVQPDDQQAE